MLDQTVIADDPVFIDLETRSACDLKSAGGWNYADHPSTQLLTVAWSPARDEYHVWFPWHTIREDYAKAQGLDNVHVHTGAELPDALQSVLHRRWCAHNGWNFDQLVWEHLFGELQRPDDWIDTEPLSRAVGLPGGLDAIAKRLWGEGKYEAGKQALKKHSRGGRRYGDAADVPAGIMPMIARYNVQDVRLLRGVWDEIIRWLRAPQEEWDVLNIHRDINHRGAAIDEQFLVSLIDLTEEGRVYAVQQIAELTKADKTPLLTINDLQSLPKMKRWLDGLFLSDAFRTRNAKGDRVVSLKRELVQAFIDVHTAGADSEGDAPDDGFDTEGEEQDDETDLDASTGRERARVISLAVRVLQLRGAALRITGGKLAAAASAVGSDGRVRGLFVYAGAHTFRWAGRRIQPQNFPRPKDGIDGWLYIDLFERERKLTYAAVDELLPDRSKPAYKNLTPDDASAAIIRSIFWAGGPPSMTSDEPWRDAPDPLGLLAADLSGIEARVLAQFAGQLDLMETFWKGDDPYIPMAEMMFGGWQRWPGVEGDYKTAKKHSYRTAGKIVRLAAGYQMSGDKLDIYAAANGVSLFDLGTSGYAGILAYRRMHPMIAGEEAGAYEGRPYFKDGIWDRLNVAAMSAVRNRGGAFTVGVGLRVTFVMDGPHLTCVMPSGRRLIYRNAEVRKVQPKYLEGTDKYIDAVVYLSPRYGWVQMYGGKWTENIIQAISRDFLAASMVRLERVGGFPIVIHVHDEAVAEGRLSQRSRFMSLFTVLPDWAVNTRHPFCLDAQGGWMPRYSKSPPPGERFSEEVWRNGSFLKAA